MLNSLVLRHKSFTMMSIYLSTPWQAYQVVQIIQNGSPNIVSIWTFIILGKREMLTNYSYHNNDFNLIKLS